MDDDEFQLFEKNREFNSKLNNFMTNSIKKLVDNSFLFYLMNLE